MNIDEQVIWLNLSGMTRLKQANQCPELQLSQPDPLDTSGILIFSINAMGLHSLEHTLTATIDVPPMHSVPDILCLLFCMRCIWLLQALLDISHLSELASRLPCITNNVLSCMWPPCLDAHWLGSLLIQPIASVTVVAAAVGLCSSNRTLQIQNTFAKASVKQPVSTSWTKQYKRLRDAKNLTCTWLISRTIWI